MYTVPEDLTWAGPISSLPWPLSLLSPRVSVPTSGPWHWLLPLLERLFYTSLQWTLVMFQMLTFPWGLYQPSYLKLLLLFRTTNLRHSGCSKYVLLNERIINEGIWRCWCCFLLPKAIWYHPLGSFSDAGTWSSQRISKDSHQMWMWFYFCERFPVIQKSALVPSSYL